MTQQGMITLTQRLDRERDKTKTKKRERKITKARKRQLPELGVESTGIHSYYKRVISILEGKRKFFGQSKSKRGRKSK